MPGSRLGKREDVLLTEFASGACTLYVSVTTQQFPYIENRFILPYSHEGFTPPLTGSLRHFIMAKACDIANPAKDRGGAGRERERTGGGRGFEGERGERTCSHWSMRLTS